MKRIFLNRSAFISIDLRNCPLSITTTHSDRDEYTRITKQDSNPVKVAHWRGDETQSDIGMQDNPNHLFLISIIDSSRNNRLLSMNRLHGFEFTGKLLLTDIFFSLPNVMVINKILSEVINHSERQLQSVNERMNVLEEYSKLQTLLSSYVLRKKKEDFFHSE